MKSETQVHRQVQLGNEERSPSPPTGATQTRSFEKSLGLCRKLRRLSVAVREKERDVGRVARVVSVVRIANLYVEAEAVARCRQPRLS